MNLYRINYKVGLFKRSFWRLFATTEEQAGETFRLLFPDKVITSIEIEQA